jgi:predicted DNA-binding WGR domain protein
VGGDWKVCPEPKSGLPLAFTLNQTDLSYGVKGHNKFYIGQLLCSPDHARFVVFFKWGRVGAANPQSSTAHFSDLATALKAFARKFRDKTKNDWAERARFKKVAGQYMLLETAGPLAGDLLDEVCAQLPLFYPAHVYRRPHRRSSTRAWRANCRRRCLLCLGDAA